MITKEIRQRLSDIESAQGIRILYACESGSRAWGFASADSDYDVRFIFTRQRDDYLGIFDPPDMLDLGIDELLIDLTGWDLRKALRLGRKSNGSLTEWLFSPIVYQQDSVIMSEWREIACRNFVPRSSAAHYLGLCRKMWGGIQEKGDEFVTAKKYLYALRSLLAALYVCEKQSPIPVPFSDLRAVLVLPPNATAEIDQMIAEKSSGGESDTIQSNEALDSFLENEIPRLDDLIKQLPDEPGPMEDFDSFFRKVLSE